LRRSVLAGRPRVTNRVRLARGSSRRRLHSGRMAEDGREFSGGPLTLTPTEACFAREHGRQKKTLEAISAEPTSDAKEDDSRKMDGPMVLVKIVRWPWGTKVGTGRPKTSSFGRAARPLFCAENRDCPMAADGDGQPLAAKGGLVMTGRRLGTPVLTGQGGGFLLAFGLGKPSPIHWPILGPHSQARDAWIPS